MVFEDKGRLGMPALSCTSQQWWWRVVGAARGGNGEMNALAPTYSYTPYAFITPLLVVRMAY